ncbi:MAG TPA: acetolactate synthase, partial [Mycobacterium sp.]|nr:acetolactate synthase [Mycobacterium sp.]
SGGHLFSIYDGCRAEGVRLIDTRHEQTAAFAAEGWSKVTRVPGVAALTAGPGVTNGMSAIGAAQQNQSPLLVLGGRAPSLRWGQGSLQEIDHVPFVAPLTRFAATAQSADAVGGLVDDALRAAAGAGGTPTGVAFVDFPMDYVFGEAVDPAVPGALAAQGEPVAADGDALEVAAGLLAGAERPVIMAGTNVWWGHAEGALLALAEAQRIPVLMNGMARGSVPADHEVAFSRARSKALKEADVALVIGVPMDFRLGFGGVFGEQTQLIVADRVVPDRPHPRAVAAELYGDLSATLTALAAGTKTDHKGWLADLRAVEDAGRAAEHAELTDDRSPLHPMRVYAELKPLLDRDAIVVIDAGDFGSYAGRVIDSYVPGAWLDSGPFGCLGSGPGYALAAKLARPDRQVVLLQGDGAFGFSGMEWDTLVRHGVHVVSVIGNNGIWALEKHPMEMLYGYSVVAELRPGTRYDEVVKALGGHGELVSTPAELRPALERAFSAGLPAVVNTLTDPQVAYPRRSNLA